MTTNTHRSLPISLAAFVLLVTTTRITTTALQPPKQPISSTPVVICPGFGNDLIDYYEPLSQPREVGLVAGLERRGFDPELISVVPVERKDWLRVAGGLLDWKFYLNQAEPTGGGYGWYLERFRTTVNEAYAKNKDDKCRVLVIGHSAGGWLARAGMGDGTWCTVTEEGETEESKAESSADKDETATRTADRICGLVTVGAIHKPPVSVASCVTRGALAFTDQSYPGAFLQDEGVAYVSIGGAAIVGNIDKESDVNAMNEEDLFKAKVARVAFTSYEAVCGQGDVMGDGVVPLSWTQLEGSKQLQLDGVLHSINEAGTTIPTDRWYGSEGVIDRWLPTVLEEAGISATSTSKKNVTCLFLARTSTADNHKKNNKNHIVLESMYSDKSQESTAKQSSSQQDRFHSDMLRVLSSRTDRGVAKLAEKSVQERRQRPEILEHDKDGVQRVFTMLNRMVKMGQATEETFQIAMRACLQRGRLRWRNTNSGDSHQSSPVICAADQMEILLGQLDGITSITSLETYLLVLEAYATCSTPRGGKYYARKAEALLDRMENSGLFGATSVAAMGQDDEIPVEALVHVLHAWAWQQENKKDGECAEKANSYLDQIERSSQKPSTDVLLQCYDWVLEAWSKSGSPRSGERAIEVFSKMKKLNETQSTSTILDTQTYSNAILARSKCKEPESAQQAHDLLLEMLARFKEGAFPHSEPELIAFNGVITAWARNGMPVEAEKVLWLMNDVRSKCKRLVPDVVSYNSVLHSYVMSPDRTEALKQIRHLVDFMEANCEEQSAICPDSFTYNTLMKAWIRSGRSDSHTESEAILGKMEMLWARGDEKVEPTNRHFNVVINAFAKSSDPFAAKKAFDLLQRMKGGSFRSKPDIISYTSVIECFSKSADPDASKIVTDLLEEAFAVHEQTGDPAIRPNLRTFTMVIQTLANCNGSIVEARNLLTRLVDLYEETKDASLMPNAYPYNYVINCAANTQGSKKEAFRLATQTYQEMRQSSYVSPDSYTYAFWFKCCNNLLKRDADLKTKCMFYAFDECRKDGLLSDTIINRLQRGTAPDVLAEWLGIPEKRKGFRDLKVTELPPDWSRNV